MSDTINKLISKLPSFTLATYILISLFLIALCGFIFPDRLPSLLGFVNRLFIGSVFVFGISQVSSTIKTADVPFLLCAVFIGAGFAV